MDFGLLFMIFLVGIMFGAAIMVSFTYHLGKRALDRKLTDARQKLDRSKKDLKSLEAKMKRVKEINQEIMMLNQSVDGPQKNALHGKDKNRTISQIKLLREEMHEVLKSIIADGHDPAISTQDESGVVTEMKLSEYMAYMGINMAPSKEERPTPKAQQIGKFTVIKGGKDDSGNTTH